MVQVEEISDILTDKAFKELKIGQILMFNYEGSRNEYKITKINRKAKRCWVKKVTTYSPDKIDIKDDQGNSQTVRENLNGTD
jgi:hypothetical protein